MEKDNKKHQLGLTDAEAKNKLSEYGFNILPEKPPPSGLSIFLSQLRNPLVYVLLGAGFLTLLLKEFSDTAIILFVVLINSILGFVQERRANNSLYSLRSILVPTAIVIRDGKRIDIETKYIVPGDVVILEQGERVPADGKLIRVNRLFVEEAVLTGESMPVEKNVGEDIFMGTTISSGEASLEVVKTGPSTEMGKIAEQVQKKPQDTPLTKQLKKLGNQLTILVVITTSFVFIVGILTGMNWIEVLTTSIALAVSSIPEGLLISVTVVLAIGMQRILKIKGLVKDLLSAETLGGVTTICVDKTGTLTYGNLEMTQTLGSVKDVCPQHFSQSKDPIMTATNAWLGKFGNHGGIRGDVLKQKCIKIDSIPFDAKNRYYASLIEHKDGKKGIYIDGAPEVVLRRCEIDERQKKKILESVKNFAKEGKRIIGIANKEVGKNTKKITEKDVEKSLNWIGLFVFSDTVRKGVKEALIKTKEAGIKTIIITGDYADTAISVARQLGLEVTKERVFLGVDLEKLSVEQIATKLRRLYEKTNEVVLFARTRPDQKLNVINALKLNNEVVAMMGDGVNDAPALHNADIGIVVGEATDVAKESANLILLDSSFSTIVATIREGRGIFDNLRKITLYLLSDSFEEIIAVVGSIIIGLPLPVTAVQILWINIVSDGFPHLSLTVDPKSKDIMKRSPLRPGTNIVAGWMKWLIFIVSLTGGIFALLIFWHYYSLDDLKVARSVAFAALGINSLVYVFSIRTLKEPFWRENPFGNKWLNIAVVVGIVFQVIPFLTPALRKFFDLAILSWENWLIVAVSSLLMFATIELLKALFRFEDAN